MPDRPHRAVQNFLLILLHRPFVADGHLYSRQSGVAISSFSICAAAATEIVGILRAYDRAFSFRRAPYLMSYATYVSATIHVRIAAQRGQNSTAHTSLAVCLEMLKANEDTNWAARKASAVIRNLMARMRVEVQAPPPSSEIQAGKPHEDTVMQGHMPASDAPQPVYDRPTGGLYDLDMDAIIQSFMCDDPSVPPESLYAAYTPDSVQNQGSPVSQRQQAYGPGLPQGGSDAHMAGSYPSAGSESSRYMQSGSDMLFGFNGSTLDVAGFATW